MVLVAGDCEEEHARPGRHGDMPVKATSGNGGGEREDGRRAETLRQRDEEAGKKVKGCESCPAGLQHARVRAEGNRRGGEKPRGRWRPEVTWW